MRYVKKPKYNTGGQIGSAIGSTATSFIPGVGPLLAPLGGMVGGLIGKGLYKEKQPEMPKNIAYSNMGYKYGGKVQPMGNGAKKYLGPKHENGGILIDEEGNPTNNANAIAEVEGGETEQNGYIFSDTLVVPNTDMTFAEAHEMLIAEGAPQEQIDELAAMQEQMNGGTNEEQMMQQPMSEPMPEEMMMAKGGLIKRADGSYSKRGLWDNIRANKGSGKKPTPEMLEQERKIKAKEMMYGGKLADYKQGGIYIKPEKRGTFKAQATRMGMGVQEAASKILSAPEGEYSPDMRRKANFARNFAKEMGGVLPKYQDGGTRLYTSADSYTNPNSRYQAGVRYSQNRPTSLPSFGKTFYGTEKGLTTKTPKPNNFSGKVLGKVGKVAGRALGAASLLIPESNATAKPLYNSPQEAQEMLGIKPINYFDKSILPADRNTYGANYINNLTGNTPTKRFNMMDGISSSEPIVNTPQRTTTLSTRRIVAQEPSQLTTQSTTSRPSRFTPMETDRQQQSNFGNNLLQSLAMNKIRLDIEELNRKKGIKKSDTSLLEDRPLMNRGGKLPKYILGTNNYKPNYLKGIITPEYNLNYNLGYNATNKGIPTRPDYSLGMTNMATNPTLDRIGNELNSVGGKTNMFANPDWGNIGTGLQSATRLGAALFTPKPKPLPTVSYNRLSTTSPVFEGARRSAGAGFRTAMGVNPQAAYAQYLDATSNIAGQEADYRGQREAMNEQMRQETQMRNLDIMGRNQQAKDADTAARIGLVSQAVDIPVTKMARDEAMKRQLESDLMFSSDRFSDPVFAERILAERRKRLGLRNGGLLKRYKKVK